MNERTKDFMDRKTQIKELWDVVTAIITGPRMGDQSYTRTSSPISQKSVNEFLNSVTLLQNAKPEELAQEVEKVRGQAHMLQAVNRIGSSDLERINLLLDKIEE